MGIEFYDVAQRDGLLGMAGPWHEGERCEVDPEGFGQGESEINELVSVMAISVVQAVNSVRKMAYHNRNSFIVMYLITTSSFIVLQFELTIRELLFYCLCEYGIIGIKA